MEIWHWTGKLPQKDLAFPLNSKAREQSADRQALAHKSYRKKRKGADPRETRGEKGTFNQNPSFRIPDILYAQDRNCSEKPTRWK